MKLQVVLLLCLLAFVLVAAMSATVPDACGDEKISFDLHFQKNAPAPAAPEVGKGQVIFIEKSKRPPTIACFNAGVSCNDVARFGVDGAWVGATKGNSYLPISLEPGVHHLCAVIGKEVHAEPSPSRPVMPIIFRLNLKHREGSTARLKSRIIKSRRTSISPC